jgi:hypothetical protein
MAAPVATAAATAIVIRFFVIANLHLFAAMDRVPALDAQSVAAQT